MNNKFYSPAQLKPTENKHNNKKANPIYSDPTSFNAKNTSEHESNLLLQLQEMKERNVQLEKQVDQYTRKLHEVTATHTKFLSIIAHDLRSPFHAILGALELLKLKLDDYLVNDIETYTNMVSISATRTLHLLDNLLDWAVSQNLEKSFNPVKVNLHALLEEEILNSISLASQKQLSLDNAISPNFIVAADILMVQTIFRNLMSNAIKYSNAGGAILITASENYQFVEIVVSDTGIGIPHEVQKRLFKLETLHSTTGTNNEHGSGLGLILCKEFIEMHGGEIRIDSEPGKGSNIIFTLPHYI